MCLSKAQFIATLDLPKAFWQLKLREQDWMKTTLAIPGRKIFFKRAAFGLNNVPSFFQNVMNEILKLENVFIYLDDVIVTANTPEYFLKTLQEIFFRAKPHRLCFGLKKCSFISSDRPIRILGAIFENGKRSIDPTCIAAILELPLPTSIGDLRSFIGSINYLRDWIPGLSTLLAQFTAFTKKDPHDSRTVKAKWTTLHTKSFIRIKE
ncbi:hypothetical protein GEMRC1_004117 [Eukaryota sp. GEM-RC1]